MGGWLPKPRTGFRKHLRHWLPSWRQPCHLDGGARRGQWRRDGLRNVNQGPSFKATVFFLCGGKILNKGSCRKISDYFFFFDGQPCVNDKRDVRTKKTTMTVMQNMIFHDFVPSWRCSVLYAMMIMNITDVWDYSIYTVIDLYCCII